MHFLHATVSGKFSEFFSADDRGERMQTEDYKGIYSFETTSGVTLSSFEVNGVGRKLKFTD